MATRADFQVLVTHPRYVSDESVRLKLEAVDLLTDLGFPGIDQTIAAAPPDTTIILFPGQVLRSFTVFFTVDFMAQYPTLAAQTEALAGLFTQAVRTQMPAQDVVVSVIFT